MIELVGVLGLARSGKAAAKLALASGSAVFASDTGDDEGLSVAASQIRQAGGEAETGGHSADRLAECDLLVVSPGIPPDVPVLRDESLRHVPRISELEFAFRHLSASVIAVTGTNGKTTVTAWAAHLLEEMGLDVAAAGNIGLALSEVAAWERQPEWVVVEASSYQLGGTASFDPRVGVVTNLAPDHLDRYPDLASYYGDKARLFQNASPASVWVLNGEDPAVMELPGDAPGRRLLFRAETQPDPDEEGAWVGASGELVLRVGQTELALARADQLGLLGSHNRGNALAAALAAYAATGHAETLGPGLRSFAPLPHRLEPVATVGGVLWVNDSKATNVTSARVSIEAMDRPTILLLGGRHKGESYKPLLQAFPGRVKVVLAYGEAADRITAELTTTGVDRVERVDGPLSAVVQRAARLADPGDAVLLAPACASFDMFSDYEERGTEYARLVRAMASDPSEATDG